VPFDFFQPHDLGFSGGAPLDRERTRTASSSQNRNDLVGAQRRPLPARGGPPDDRC